MKKQLFALIIALISITQTAFSQDVKVKFRKDTAFIDGKPVCLCKDRSAGTEYRILTLKNRELVFAKAENVGMKAYFKLTFLDNGAQCEREFAWKFGTGLVRDLYERGALTFDSDSLNENGLKKFLMTNNRKYSEEFKAEQKQTVKDEAAKEAAKSEIGSGAKIKKSNQSPTLVKRDITRSVSTSGSDITQDFKTIGTYKEENVSVTGKKVTVFSVDGDPIAEVIFKSMSDKTGELFLFADREKSEYTTKQSSLSSYMFIRELAQYLIDNRYL